MSDFRILAHVDYFRVADHRKSETGSGSSTRQHRGVCPGTGASVQISRRTLEHRKPNRQRTGLRTNPKRKLRQQAAGLQTLSQTIRSEGYGETLSRTDPSSSDLALSPGQVKILDDASHIDLGFPQQPNAEFTSICLTLTFQTKCHSGGTSLAYNLASEPDRVPVSR